MIHHGKVLDLEVTVFENYHDPIHTDEVIPSLTSNLKHVENTKVLDKLTYDTSFRRS